MSKVIRKNKLKKDGSMKEKLVNILFEVPKTLKNDISKDSTDEEVEKLLNENEKFNKKIIKNKIKEIETKNKWINISLIWLLLLSIVLTIAAFVIQDITYISFRNAISMFESIFIIAVLIIYFLLFIQLSYEDELFDLTKEVDYKKIKKLIRSVLIKCSLPFISLILSLYLENIKYIILSILIIVLILIKLVLFLLSVISVTEKNNINSKGLI